MKDVARATEQWTFALNQGLSDAIFRARSFGEILESLLKRLFISGLFGNDGKSGLLGGLTNKAGSFLGNLPGFATGGTPPINSPFIVGENGPEILSVGRASHVFSNAQSKRMLSSGGSQAPTINNYNTFQTQTKDTIRETIFEMMDILKAEVMNDLGRANLGVR